MSRYAQLSFLTSPRIRLRYYPAHQPPEASGPFEFGTYAASLSGRPGLCAYGNSEQTALRALALVLEQLAGEEIAPLHLTAFGQVLTAAKRLDREAFLDYLRERADEPVVA